jgi:hypothetical protein
VTLGGPTAGISVGFGQLSRRCSCSERESIDPMCERFILLGIGISVAARWELRSRVTRSESQVITYPRAFELVISGGGAS